MVDIFMKRRKQVYRVHLIILSIYLILIVADWLSHALGLQRDMFDNTSKWLLMILLIHSPTIIYNIVLEVQISRNREVKAALEDEMYNHDRLLAWRNGFLGMMLFLLLQLVLSGTKIAPDSSQLVMMGMIIGAIVFLGSLLVSWRGAE